jgi:hypothetical protein
MLTSLSHFLPDPAYLIGLGGVAVWCVAFAVLGGVWFGRHRIAELDIPCGFGLVCLAFTVLGALTPIGFTYIAYALLIAAVPAGIHVYRRDGRLVEAGALMILAMSAPLILLITDMIPSQWDEFGTWLPNARYLYDHDGFPTREAPNALSALPAYPYGMPTVTYLASRITGRFVENATALFNVVLFLCLALALARLIAAGLNDRDEPPVRLPTAGGENPVRPGWAICAVGALGVTALNPTFVKKLVFTAYSDPSTTALMGLGGLAMVLYLEAVADGETRRARRIAWQAGLIAAALINIRQANLVLVVALGAGTLVAGWRDPRVALADIVRPLILPMALPAAIYLAWRYHVAGNFEGGEFSIRAVADWYFHLMGDIAARMALVASKKGGYFGVMLVALFVAIRALWAVRSPLDRLAVITATVFVIYNAFLFFTYLTAFGEYEARNVASYWRYNTHLGGLCVVFAAYGLARLWRARVPRGVTARLRWAPIVLLLLVPFVFAKKIRFDDDPIKNHVRVVGDSLARTLNPDHRLAIVDETHNGEYAVVLRYAVESVAAIAAMISSFDKRPAAEIRATIDAQKASHVWVYKATEKAQKIVGVPLDKGASHLLKRATDSGWRLERSWTHEPPRR